MAQHRNDNNGTSDSNSITKESVSRESMFLYMVLLMTVGVIGDLLASAVQTWLGWFL